MTTLERQRPTPPGQSGSDKAETAELLYKEGFAPGVFALRLGAILALSLVCYILLSSNWAKFSRAEVFFGECAKEMLASGNLLTPLFHGQGFFDKPILSYWLVCMSYKLFGISHLAARIPSCLAALATVLITALAGRRLFGAKQGLYAAIALASSVMFISFASMCMSDMLLIFFDTAALILLYLGSEADSPHRRSILWLAASAAIGFAFVTKGPIGLALPGATFTAYLAVTRQLSLIRASHVLTGIGTILLIGLPWFLATYLTCGPESLLYFFVRENLERFAGRTYDTHQPFWFMLHSLLTGFAPWSVLLFVGAKQLFQHIKEKTTPRSLTFLWLWVAVVTAFFSISRGKIDYYVLPAHPACALIVAYTLSQWDTKRSKLVAAAAVVLALVLIIGSPTVASLLPALIGSVLNCATLPVTLLVFGVTALVFACQGKIGRSVAATGAGILVTGSILAVQTFPLLDANQPMYTYIQRIKQCDSKTTVGVFGMNHWRDEITFQTGRETVGLNNYDELVAFLRRKDRILAVVPNSYYAPMLPEFKTGVHVIESHPYVPHGLNPGYIFEQHGHIVADTPLLLLENISSSR